jgi:signal transduction histidine kinase/ActR/RegA family two-component response regulator
MNADVTPTAPPPVGIRHRLETHVALAVTLLVALALGAAMIVATRVVSAGSFERASSDLAAARTAFYRLADDRAEFAATQAALVTALPVFRAHMTDTQLAADAATMQVMADEYRQQLKAAFCIVTGRDGRWTASSGWPQAAARPASIGRMIASSAAGRSGRDNVEVAGRLFLVVSEPARFAEETLGTLTVGYALDDAVARRLAEVTHCDVNIVVGPRLAASSLSADRRAALTGLIANGWPAPGGAPRLERLGSSEYVSAAFALSPAGEPDPGRLVLLQDWAPTDRYLARLRNQLFAAGIGIFAVALAGGLWFARRIGRPLNDLASAAGDIASGNWDRQVPARGSLEAVGMARAFNAMTGSLRHWYEQAKKRDDDLRHAQKMAAIGRLAGGIAHDFNNLLTAIRGYAELVLLRMDADDSRRGDTSEIIAATERATDLTKQLLAFSRRQDISPRVLAFDRLVAAAEPMLRSVIGEDVTLVTAIKPGTGRIRADSGQIEQVLLNLVINARDAMPHGGTLRIGLANVDVGAAPHDVQHPAIPGPYVCLSVADTGHGMDRQTAARIFEPFFTTKAAGHGTGLGLAMVFGIVEDAGGMMDVESEPEQGATFRVYLPRTSDPEDAEHAVPNLEGADTPAQGSETVLLAEDDDRLSVLITKSLRRAGYKVLQASHGEEALDIARTYAEPIHLLITDVVMTGMNGSILSAQLRALRHETRVLYMSGHSDDTVQRHGVLAASAEFIKKPFAMDKLMAKMRELLQREP